MKTIYLVRHGEAAVNVGDVWVSDEELGLTERGREQARFIAERASALPIEVLISSNMPRAKETAQIINDRIQKPYESWDVLNERPIPQSIVGRSRTDPEAFKVMSAYTLSFEHSDQEFQGGESFALVRARVIKAFELLERRAEKNILVVGHSFFTRMLVAVMLYGRALTPEQFEPFIYGLRTENTGVTVLKYHPEDPKRAWWLSVWNDHAHLD